MSSLRIHLILCLAGAASFPDRLVGAQPHGSVAEGEMALDLRLRAARALARLANMLLQHDTGAARHWNKLRTAASVVSDCTGSCVHPGLQLAVRGGVPAV